MRSNLSKAVLLITFYVVWIVLLSLELSGDALDTTITVSGPIPLAMAVLALEQRHAGPVGWLRGIAPGFFPGAIAGVASWLGLRVAMRLVALAAGVPTSFTMAGTLEVLLIGVVLGASYGALLAAVWQSIAATPLAPGRWGGIALALWLWYPFFLAADGNLRGLVAAPLIVLFTTLLSGMWIA